MVTDAVSAYISERLGPASVEFISVHDDVFLGR